MKFSTLQEDGQLFHKGYTYLLKKQNNLWFVKQVYVDGNPKPEDIYKDILDLTRLEDS